MTTGFVSVAGKPFECPFYFEFHQVGGQRTSGSCQTSYVIGPVTEGGMYLALWQQQSLLERHLLAGPDGDSSQIW